MNKIFNNNNFMEEAIKMAKAALLADEVPVGAIIVNPLKNEIVAKAHNLVENKKNPTAHAEMLAIEDACRSLSSKILSGLDLYVTLQPCLMCFQAITYAKIKRIYFGAYDHGTSLRLSDPNHIVEIYGGIHEHECKELLDIFFKSKRNL